MNKPAPELVRWMLKAHEEFACKLSLDGRLAELGDAEPEEIRRVVQAVVEAACDKALTSEGVAPSLSQRRWMTEGVLDQAFGLGLLEPLLRNGDGDAIVILGPRDVCVERDGQLVETAVVFADEEHVVRTLERRPAIEPYLARVPGEGGPSWRIDLNKLRERQREVAAAAAASAEVLPAAAAASAPAASAPVASQSAEGLGGWLKKLWE